MPDSADIHIRKLPAGDLHPAGSIVNERTTCRLEFGAAGVPADFAMEVPVEIVTRDTILLGAVMFRGETRLEVQIEHAIDRTRLAPAWGD